MIINGNKNINQNIKNIDVSLWLICTIITLIFLIIIGGITRLTESGLSITEWQPISGIFFPFSEASWQKEFDKYKQIPEFFLVNSSMTLAEFKIIYFWEWFHRSLARFLGLVFLIPYLYFIYKKKFSKKEKTFLPFILLMGVLQAFVGWYMVQSGLVEDINVSQYRLATHLSIAFFILGCLFLLYLSRSENIIYLDNRPTLFLKISSFALLILTFIQIILGAFMSGTRSGLTYNTWPLIDGQFIPDGLFSISVWYLNFFENPLTIHFDHRMLGYALCIILFTQIIYINKRFSGTPYKSSSLYLLAIMLYQVILGIIAVIYQVPIIIGVLHQFGAVLLFLGALRHFYLINYCRFRLLRGPALDRR